MKLKYVILVCLVFLMIENGSAQCDALIANQSQMSGCSGTEFTLALTASNGMAIWGEYNWYVNGSSGWQLVSPGYNNFYQTPALSESKQYRAIVNLDGCATQNYDFYASIISPPTTPVPGHASVCGQGAMNLSVAYVSNYSYEWYELSTGNKLTPGITGVLSAGQSYTLTGIGYSQLLVDNTSQSISFEVRAYDLANTTCGYTSSVVNGTVKPPPSVSAGSNQSVCISGGNITLNGTPSGGTWSGNGVLGDTFSPGNAGPGIHSLQYVYIDPSTGCSAGSSKTITVGPNVSVGTMTTCNSSVVFGLLATPAGGTWSGNYVTTSTGSFNANAAGIGTHTVTYSYTASGCTVSKSGNVVVTTGSWYLPYEGKSTRVCSAGSVRLSVDDHGNSNGDIENYQWFDESDIPLIANGNYVYGISYDTPFLTENKTYRVRGINNSGCQSFPLTITTDIQTMPSPPVVVDGYNCSNGAGVITVNAVVGENYIWKDPNGVTIDPFVTGGAITYQFSGAGNSVLSVSGISDANDFTVTVEAQSIQNNSCPSSSTTLGKIYFRTLPVVTINTVYPSYMCLTSPAISFSGGSPQGGSWSVNSTVAQLFNPVVSGLGQHVLSYGYTDQYGCYNKADKTIEVKDLAKAQPGYKLIDYGSSIVLEGYVRGYNESFRWYSASGTLLGEGDTFETGYLTHNTDFFLSKFDVSYPSCESSQRVLFRVATLPSNNHNYVREEVVMIPSITQVNDVSSLSHLQKAEKTTYVDGLGRPSQVVSREGSPAGADMVEPIIYDDGGRETFKYLPYTSMQSNGWYKSDPTGINNYEDSPQYQFYNGMNEKIAGDNKPYAKVIYEKSPFNRVVKQGAPGQSWQPGELNENNPDYSIKKKYELNVILDSIYSFSYIEEGEIHVDANVFYTENSLYANKTYDEKNNLIIEYTGKEGRTICKKVQASKPNEPLVFASTYYIYDDLGNLVLVLPPEGVEKLKAALNLN